MKKLTIVLTLCISFFISCTGIETMPEQKVMKTNDFAYFGDIHNKVLAKFHNYYKGNECDLNDLKSINTFLSSFYSNQIGDIKSDKNNLCYSIDDMQESIGNVIFPIVATNSNPQTRGAVDMLTDEKIDAMLNDSVIEVRNVTDVLCLANYAYRHEMIDLDSYNFFSQMLELIDEGINDTIATCDVKNDLNIMTKKVDSQACLRNDSSMMISGPILSISNASCEYWSNEMQKEYCSDSMSCTKEEADSVIKRNLPPFVYADAGGAVLGAIGNAYQQYKKYGKVTYYGNIGKAALGDAITSSIGADMFLGKFLVNGIIRIAKPCSDAFGKIVFKLF